MTFPTEPDHVPYIPLIEEARTEPLTEKPTAPWPRGLLPVLNLILLVLAGIFVILGIGALRTVKAEREDKVRSDTCEYWEQNFSDLPAPEYC